VTGVQTCLFRSRRQRLQDPQSLVRHRRSAGVLRRPSLAAWISFSDRHSVSRATSPKRLMAGLGSSRTPQVPSYRHSVRSMQSPTAESNAPKRRPTFYADRDPTLAFGTGIPFGLNARHQHAWWQAGGGGEIVNEVLHRFGVHAIAM